MRYQQIFVYKDVHEEALEPNGKENANMQKETERERDGGNRRERMCVCGCLGGRGLQRDKVIKW